MVRRQDAREQKSPVLSRNMSDDRKTDWRSWRDRFVVIAIVSAAADVVILPIGIGYGGAGHGTWGVYYAGLLIGGLACLAAVGAILAHLAEKYGAS